MASYRQLTEFAATLPGTEQFLLMGQPALRVGRKTFALWWPPQKRTILKLERGHQAMLFEVAPDIFQPCKVGTGYWSFVALGKLKPAEMRALVTEAWSTVAPKKRRR